MHAAQFEPAVRPQRSVEQDRLSLAKAGCLDDDLVFTATLDRGRRHAKSVQALLESFDGVVDGSLCDGNGLAVFIDPLEDLQGVDLGNLLRFILAAFRFPTSQRGSTENGETSEGSEER